MVWSNSRPVASMMDVILSVPWRLLV